MEAPDNAYAVILAGGAGTRLWPKSRSGTPKHFLDLFGQSRTLIQLTFDRIEGIIPHERIFVITTKDQLPLLRKQLPQIPEKNIIIEPLRKNTALAMGTVAAFIHKQNENATIFHLAADQMFSKVSKFQETVLTALKVAEEDDYLVAIGIRPTFPHTGLGYIKIGDQLETSIERRDKIFAFKSKGFKEKPNLVTAQSFLASGQYLWNANIYCWQAKNILSALKKYSPNIYKGVIEIEEAVGTPKEKEVLQEVYGQAENIQIDYAVSEKADNIVVIPGDFDWSDIGSWKVVYDVHEKDKDRNVIVDKENNLINIDSKNCLVETNGRLLVTIGLEDIIIVDTEDATMICRKDRTQDVKKAVEKLIELKKDKYL